jgi:hypothetical protein
VKCAGRTLVSKASGTLKGVWIKTTAFRQFWSVNLSFGPGAVWKADRVACGM